MTTSPAPWSTDIELAAEMIKQEGAYQGMTTLRNALEEIADGHKNPKTIARKALDAERDDARIDGAVIYAPGGDQICSFPHDPEDNLVLDDETISNAKLMAASPELLAACKSAASAMADGQLRKQLLTAIERATI